jgi:electron transfer flavoprotein beta subunit
MNIIVCVKQVIDPLSITIDLETNTIDASRCAYVINPLDAVALEEAVRMKRSTSGNVTAVTVGPQTAESIVRDCMLKGADHAIHMVVENEFDELTTAFILGATIQTVKYDVILCGKQSVDGTGLVGPVVAEFLGLPQVTSTARIEVNRDDNTAIIHRRLEKQAREVVECRLPAVFTIEKRSGDQVLTPLAAFMGGLKKTVDKRYIEQLSLDQGSIQPTTQTIGTFAPKPRVKKTSTIDSSLPPMERMRLAMSGGVAEKSDKLKIDEPADSAVTKMIAWLTDHKFISPDI